MFDINEETTELFDIYCNGVNIVEEEAQFVEDELVGFSTVYKKDREVEVEYYDLDDHGFVVKVVDDGCGVDQPWWTRSGDNPVLLSESELHDAKCQSRWFSEIQAPRKNYYSTSSSKWGSGKRQERNFHLVVGWINKNKDKPATLRRGWSRFWKRVYEQKANGLPCSYMFPKQIAAVKNLFTKHGITSLKK